MKYRIECDANFTDICFDPEAGMFGDIEHRGLTLEEAERNKAILDTTGDWPDRRPTYTIVPDVGPDKSFDFGPGL